MVLNISQIDYLIGEEKTSNNSPLFGLVDLSLYCTIFNKFQNVFSTFWFFLFHYSSTSKVSEEEQNTIMHESKGRSRDRDSGIVEREEVKMVMQNLGLFCSSESEELKEKYGSKELSELFDEQEPSLEEVKQSFDVFDVNKDGFVDAEELQRVLCILGLKEAAQLENCNKMIRNFDENQDGRIDFIEFVKIMENGFF